LLVLERDMPRISIAIIGLLVAGSAEAYIGPGAGIGLLGSLWAWLVGLVVVVSAIAFWPVRWAWRRLRRGRGRGRVGDADAPPR
jgi:hypothetical protein